MKIFGEKKLPTNNINRMIIVSSTNEFIVSLKVSQLCPTVCAVWNSPWNSPGQTIRVGSLSLFQGFFPTQGNNLGILHCRQILYQLSHKGTPRILKWVAYSFSSGSSWLRNQTGFSCIAGRFFTNWAIREALSNGCKKTIKYNLALRVWNPDYFWTYICYIQIQELDESYYMTQEIWGV